MAENGIRRSSQHVATGLRALYSDPRLQPRLERFRQAADPLDCLEELALARALLEQFLDSYQEQNAWAEAWQRAKVEEGKPPPPIRWLYLDDGLKFVKVIGDLAKAIQGMRVADQMSKAEVKFKIFQLARVVEDVVQQQQVGDGWRDELLAAIKERWMEIWI